MTTPERGAIGGVEVLPFCLLIFVAGSLALLHGFAVVNAKLAVEDAVREGARAAVSADAGTPAASLARVAAGRTLAGAGLDPKRLALYVNDPGDGRCGLVVVSGSYRVPGVRLPFLATMRVGTTVRATHREHVDRFASGRSGDATCA